MKRLTLAAALLVTTLLPAANPKPTTPLGDIPLTEIDGNATSLKAYSRKVLLLVNVASKCG